MKHLKESKKSSEGKIGPSNEKSHDCSFEVESNGNIGHTLKKHRMDLDISQSGDAS
jgi:hypothetical protein